MKGTAVGSAVRNINTQLRDERYWWNVVIENGVAKQNEATFNSVRRGNTGYWPYDRAAFQKAAAVVWGIGADVPIEEVSGDPAHPGVMQQVLNEARLTWRKEETRIWENVPAIEFCPGLGVLTQDSTGGVVVAAPSQHGVNGLPALPNRENLYVPEEFDDQEAFELLVNLNATTLVVTNDVVLRLYMFAATIR